MRVSIGIPAYNAERFLAATIESVRAQAVPDWELVVVNDGSQDGTLAIAQRFAIQDSRIRVIDKPNEGVAVTRTCAFEAMSPAVPYVIFLDADDLWEPDTLTLLIKALENDPDVAAAHGDACFIDSQDRPLNPGALEAWCRAPRCAVTKRLEPVPECRTSFAVLAYRCCIASSGAVLMRREALSAVGEWDPKAVPCEDWDLWIRLSARSSFAYVDRVVLNYRRHQSNVSSSRHRMSSADYYVRRKFLADPIYSRAQKETMRRGFRLLKQQTGREKQAEFYAQMRRGRLGPASREIVAALRCSLSAIRGIPGS